MAKPTKHYGRWRIRWVDEHGQRQSAVFDDYKTAALELRKNEIEVEERRRGLRAPEPPRRNVGDAVKYWREHRSPLKRSGDDDESIFRSIEPFFGTIGLHDAEGIIGAVDRYRASKVFTNREGRMLLPSSRVFQETLHRVLKRAAFENVVRNGKSRPYIRFHDLRHTFASHWVMNGGDLFKLQKILGHKTVQMTMRYAHLQPAAFREDYGRMGAAPADGELIALSKAKNA